MDIIESLRDSFYLLFESTLKKSRQTDSQTKLSFLKSWTGVKTSGNVPRKWCVALDAITTTFSLQHKYQLFIYTVVSLHNFVHIFRKITRMTTSISSEAVWNYKKHAWTTENFHVFTFLPYVAWPTYQQTKYLYNRCFIYERNMQRKY